MTEQKTDPKANAMALVTKLESYIPDNYKQDKLGFISLVNSQVLGVTRDGKNRSFTDLQFFLSVAKRTGLDPLARQVYAVYRWNGRTKSEAMSIQTSIDGFRLVAQRSGEYAGQEDAVFVQEDEFNPVTNKSEKVFKALVTVYKMVNGNKCNVTASARWEEYVQKDKDGNIAFMWKQLPKVMLAKCAEALALRKAFPQELSGLYTAEEMAQADNPKAEASKTINDLPKPVKTEQPSEPQAPIEGEVVETKKVKKVIKNVEDAKKVADELINKAQNKTSNQEVNEVLKEE